MNTDKAKGYTLKEMLAVMFGYCVLLVVITGCVKLGYEWAGFGGSVLGYILGCIIGIFAFIGMIVVFVFALWLFLKTKKTNKEKDNI